MINIIANEVHDRSNFLGTLYTIQSVYALFYKNIIYINICVHVSMILEDKHEMYRALMTTTLYNDLTEPLQEDGNHNFKHQLYELPYRYIDLY